ncbi:MAG TPA: Uma2 family endonuclease, partial [Bacillota bacterium]|nr:Uma2 family endonuclease [Bacillota bacterium]
MSGTRKLTYGDLKKLPADEQWELINGIPYRKARPSFTHQNIMLELASQIRLFLRGKPGQVVTEPALWLAEMSDSASDYLLPDIAVVGDPKKIIADTGIVGAPDLIIEVISPENDYIDRHIKLRRYRLAGVKEYWIVDPQGFISVLTLFNNHYRIDSFSEGRVKVSIFDDLE